MATSKALNDGVKKAIKRERERVKKSRISDPVHKHHMRDYPAVVVACGCKQREQIFTGTSKSTIGYEYVPMLKNELEKLAPIGQKRSGCNNTVGACAEPHAADLVFRDYPVCDMSDLQFSEAYRPRTGQRIPYCKNCKDVFHEVL